MSFGGKWRSCRSYQSTQSNDPEPLDNTLKLVLYGFIYSETPVFFNENGEMINLQYYADVNRLSYIWTFYKNKNQDISSLRLILVTSEDVMPSIYEEITGTDLNVHRIERVNGRTKWLVYY